MLTDLVKRPLLRDADLDLERNVVLEELNGVLDTPDDLVGELWNETMWPEHPYGYSILGTPESVGALGTGDLRAVHQQGYYAGNSRHRRGGEHRARTGARAARRAGLVRRRGAAPAGGRRGGTRRFAASPAPRCGTCSRCTSSWAPTPFPRPTSAAGAWPCSRRVIGGGMSSRLFQRVREELGLCYAIHAWHASYRAAGVFGIYVGTQPATADRALAVINEELARVSREGLPPQELADAKGQIKGSVMLALESTVSRMNRLAVHVLNDEAYRSIDEILQSVDGVTGEETASLAGAFLAPERMTTVRLGPSA